MTTEWRVTTATGAGELQEVLNRTAPAGEEEWILDRIMLTCMATTEGARAQFVLVEYRDGDAGV